MEFNVLADFVSVVLDGAVASCVQLAGGKNNKLYSLVLNDGREVVAKCYLISSHDTRDRCGAEFAAHSFLWQAGCRSIAAPLGRSVGGEVAFYSKIEGTRPSSYDKGDIDQAVLFAGSLAEYSRDPHAEALANASEASFAAHDLSANLRRRYGQLNSLALERSASRDFNEFVEGALRKAVDEACLGLSQTKSRSFFVEPLTKKQQILSPSDFGFHNGLRARDGSWRFLDFEYFGWDDPAKLICDFVLHPAMALDEALREYFQSTILQRFAHFDELDSRVAILAPCYRAKWSMIMLNEFHREHRRRREFSLGEVAISDGVLAEQLEKAKKVISFQD